jgi:hypothetical protein
MTRQFVWPAVAVLLLCSACGDEGGSSSHTDDTGAHDDAGADSDADTDDGGNNSEPDLPDEFDPSADDDGDGLSNGDEAAIGTDMGNADSDQDGLLDAAEVGDVTNPSDEDGDGRPDALESDLADNDSDGVRDQADPDDAPGGWQFSYASFYPFAVTADGAEPTRVEVRLTGDISEARLGASTDPASPFAGANLSGVTVDGSAVTSIELKDDGTMGDRRAGDGVWSRGGVAVSRQVRNLGTVLMDEVSVVTPSGESSRAVWTGYMEGAPVFSSGPFLLGLVAPGDYPEPELVGEGAWRSENLAVVSDAAVVGEWRRYMTLQRSDIAALTRAVYAHWDDEFDFLYFFPSTVAEGGVAGNTINARTGAGGIGVSDFDNTADFGSGGRLRAVAGLNFQENGPLLHETMHHWGVFLDAQFGFQGTHWGFAGTQGQLGGFDPGSVEEAGEGRWLVDPFGTFANGGDGLPYGLLELYLMGLIPAEEVGDIPVFEGASIAGRENGKTVIMAQALRMVTLEEMIAVHGPREPAVDASLREYRGLFTLLTDHAPTASEVAFYDQQAAVFGAPMGNGFLLSFEQATGGRASMQVEVPEPR